MISIFLLFSFIVFGSSQQVCLDPKTLLTGCPCENPTDQCVIGLTCRVNSSTNRRECLPPGDCTVNPNGEGCPCDDLQMGGKGVCIPGLRCWHNGVDRHCVVIGATIPPSPIASVLPTPAPTYSRMDYPNCLFLHDITRHVGQVNCPCKDDPLRPCDFPLNCNPGPFPICLPTLLDTPRPSPTPPLQHMYPGCPDPQDFKGTLNCPCREAGDECEKGLFCDPGQFPVCHSTAPTPPTASPTFLTSSLPPSPRPPTTILVSPPPSGNRPTVPPSPAGLTKVVIVDGKTVFVPVPAVGSSQPLPLLEIIGIAAAVCVVLSVALLAACVIVFKRRSAVVGGTPGTEMGSSRSSSSAHKHGGGQRHHRSKRSSRSLSARSLNRTSSGRSFGHHHQQQQPPPRPRSMQYASPYASVPAMGTTSTHYQAPTAASHYQDVGAVGYASPTFATEAELGFRQ